MHFHFHKWSRWAEPVMTYSGHVQQWRVCEACNATSFRTLRWHNQTSLTAILASLKNITKL